MRGTTLFIKQTKVTCTTWDVANSRTWGSNNVIRISKYDIFSNFFNKYIINTFLLKKIFLSIIFLHDLNFKNILKKKLEGRSMTFNFILLPRPERMGQGHQMLPLVVPPTLHAHPNKTDCKSVLTQSHSH